MQNRIHADAIANAVKAIGEEEELEALIGILGDDQSQSAVANSTLPVLIASVQLGGL